MWYFVFILFSHLVYMYLCTLTFSRKIYNTPMNFYVAKLFRHHSEIRLWFWKNKHVVEKKFWTKIIWISVCECKNTCSWNWKTRVYQYICVLGYVKHPTVYIQTQWITWIWGIVDNKFDEIKVKCRTTLWIGHLPRSVVVLKLSAKKSCLIAMSFTSLCCNIYI